MAVLVVAAAGAYVGAAVGIGAAAGWVIGSYLYSSFLAPGQKKNVRTSELNDLRVMGTEYGQPIPYIIGTMAVAGDLWWNSDRRPVVTTSTTESGGKGGGGSETTTTVTTYDMDALIGLCDNRIVGVMRIWDEGKLVWSAHPESPPESIEASAETITWDRMTVYTGDPAQMPDPTYEAAFGVGNVPAYRHRAYVFFEGLHLGQSGRVPNFTFEIVTDGGETSETWDERPMPSPFHYFGTAHRAAAVGSGAVVITNGPYNFVSEDGGASWTEYGPVHDNLPADFRNLAFGDGTFVICGQTSNHPPGGYETCYYSTDNCRTWLPASGSALPTFGIGFGNAPALCYWSAGNKFMAVRGENFPGEEAYYVPVMVSGNGGRNWTHSTSLTLAGWAALDVNDSGRFIAISGTPTAPFQIAISDNSGATWSYRSTPIASTWWDIKWAGGSHWVACNRESGAAQSLITSDDDGETWTVRPTGDTSRTPFRLAADRQGTVILTYSTPSTNSARISRDYGHTWADDGFTAACGLNAIVYDPATGKYFSAGEKASLGSKGIFVRNPSSLVNSETVTLEETVRRLLVRCGMVEGTQFDVSALASITKPVRALYVSQVSPTRQTIDALASTYFFDMCVSDKLYFRPRGGAIAATIPYEDLGAAFDGSADELDQFILKNSGDLEFPARVSLVYRNVMHEYQVDTQTSDRLVSASADTAKVITLPLCFTPGEAKQCADVMLFNQAVNMLSVDSIKVLGDYVALEPTDPVTVFDAQGNSYRMRLTSRRDEYPLLEYSAVLDDVAILTSSGVTDENYEESFIVEAVPLTVDLLLDIPMLRDADTDLGMYAVAKGATGAKWPGCVIYVSGDGVNYDSVGAIAYPNIFGICQTTLGNWPRGRLIDEANRVTVNVGPGVALSSSTYERVVNNKAVNACVIGDEVLQFIDATATGDGVYVLSRLLRGSQGTERAMGTHTAGERFALLDPGRLGRVVTPNNLLGVPLDYKFVTIGKTLESDAPETVANTGVNLKPISPVYLQVYRDPANNDATISWERRSRFTVRVLGPGGIDVPPDEVGWEVDVYTDGTYATRVRTITATVAARPSAVYYAAEQSADGLTPGAPLFLRIYPMSGAVGRGFPLTASM